MGPDSHKPGSTKEKLPHAPPVTYHIALTKPDQGIFGPWMTLQDALETHPQRTSGTLYGNEKDFMVVATEGDKQTVLYNWNDADQQWVKVATEDGK